MAYRLAGIDPSRFGRNSNHGFVEEELIAGEAGK
jgi:hypothetical protein